MRGGIISHNIASRLSGGGVQNQGLNNIDGYFSMYGGEISHNTAKRSGGGVNISSTSVYIMNGGTIRANNAYHGGGVRVWGNFVMRGGRIIDNTASYGGGVYIRGEHANFDHISGEISNNHPDNIRFPD